jgi:hypothetical protein
MNPRLVSPSFALLLAATAADRATAQLVHFPDATLANPPQFAFPFYTPGAGSTGQTVRLQVLCPDSFLSLQNLTAGFVTRLQFSLAGAATYDTFELRAGATSVTTLTNDWAVNLPDQRVQRDLANQVLIGGGTTTAPANAWIEIELDHPFHWQPGQGIVVDLTTHVAVPGVVLGTTTAMTGGIQRAYNFGYTPGAPATNVNTGGIAVGLVFASTDIVTFGAGCSGPGGVAPSLSSAGQSTLGGTILVIADGARNGSVGGFLWGTSRRVFAGGLLPAPLGGACSLLVAPEVFVDAPITPGSAGGAAACALAIPNDPLLLGAVVYTQFAQFDPATPAIVPLSFSNGGAVVVY